MLSQIIDTHCHYDDNAFDIDRDTLLPEILSDIRGAVHASTDGRSSLFGIETAERFKNF